MELALTTPRHGEWPFQVCHIDHTELDVELLCSVTGTNLGRPWLSILTDAFSRRMLAVFLSFDPPGHPNNNESETSKKTQNVGRRNPVRDRIGISEGACHAT
jgi:hypothetical protein